MTLTFVYITKINYKVAKKKLITKYIYRFYDYYIITNKFLKLPYWVRRNEQNKSTLELLFYSTYNCSTHWRMDVKDFCLTLLVLNSNSPSVISNKKNITRYGFFFGLWKLKSASTKSFFFTNLMVYIWYSAYIKLVKQFYVQSSKNEKT